MSKRVVVGLSGGVDSSVSAALLLEQGYEVIGLFMRNWHDESVTLESECPWIEDSNDALLVAQTLGIPFQVIDLSEAYKERIVNYMFSEYENGRTPNPDVLCNREIKFDIFLKTALELGADYVATGHYCQKKQFESNGKIIYQLLAGADKNKDQSYFLCQLTQKQLEYALFPIGHLQKSEVRTIAQKYGLATAEKKDSQGLCFVGKIKLPIFLQQQLKQKIGDVVEIPVNFQLYSFMDNTIDKETDFEKKLKLLSKSIHYRHEDGSIIGKHQGAHFFTIGQRKGLQIGGKKEPIFVIATDTTHNIIYVGQGESHPGLNRKALFIPKVDVHWIRKDLEIEIGQDKKFLSRIRYRQPLVEVTIYARYEGLYLVFAEDQKGITPGQFAAWYENDELIGSGVIS
jgi:tRNA-uridine 2-sulfurtransferase